MHGEGPRRAFTLIELLVVISIISLLISILMPALAGSRQRATAVACASNLRQIGMALGDYIIGNDGYYPGDHREEGGSHIMWAPRLRRLLGGDTRVFHCPANPKSYNWREEDLNGDEFFSYGYNGWGIKDFSRDASGRPIMLGLGGHVWYEPDAPESEWEYRELHERRVAVPDDMVAIGDSFSDGFWDTWITPQQESDACWPSKRHYGGSQILFCDGHVGYLKQEDLLKRSVPTMSRWNNDHQPHEDCWYEGNNCG